MRTSIDSAGRIVIPKPIREKLGLTGGEPLEVRERSGVLEIEPATTKMSLEEREGVLAAFPETELPQLSAEAVRAELERLRR